MKRSRAGASRRNVCAIGAAAALVGVFPGTVPGALADDDHSQGRCDRDDDGREKHGLHVHVSSAPDLETKVGDPAYANYRIVLAAGIYHLAGELVLQPGQSIIGQQRYVDRDGDDVPDPVDASRDPADPDTVYAREDGATTLVLPPIPPDCAP